MWVQKVEIWMRQNKMWLINNEIYIPIYCLYRKNGVVSSSIKAVTNNFFEYSNKDEFLRIVEDIVKKYEK